MIHINEEKNILRYRLHDDSNHAWVYFTLDLDRYELIISGEVTASYKWVETKKSESFIELMLRCNAGYLTNKLGYSIPKEFNLEKSIEETIENFKDYYEEVEEDFYEDIRNIDVSTSEGFYKAVEEIEDVYFIDTSDFYTLVECVEEPPYWLKKSVEYFCEHIKPILKEYVKND